MSSARLTLQLCLCRWECLGHSWAIHILPSCCGKFTCPIQPELRLPGFLAPPAVHPKELQKIILVFCDMAMVGTGRHSMGRVSPLQMQELLHSWVTLDPFFRTPPILSLAVQVKGQGAKSSNLSVFSN